MKIINNSVEEDIYEKKLKDIVGIYIEGAESAYFFDNDQALVFAEECPLPYTTFADENETIRDFIMDEIGEYVPITKVFYGDDFLIEVKF